MKKHTVEEARHCLKCCGVENQIKRGLNRSGTQRCVCLFCGTRYTLEPKSHVYAEETRQLAIKTTTLA